MRAITSTFQAANILTTAKADVAPEIFDECLRGLSTGAYTLWVGDGSAIAVTRTGSDALYVKHFSSKAPGGIARNWATCVGFAEMAGVNRVICQPLRDSHARLYRTLGFARGSNDTMVLEL